MSLCRHYVRELRRSVLVATPELEKAGSKRSSTVLENLENLGDISLGEPGPSGVHNRHSEEKDADQRLSAFLRLEGQGHSPQGSLGSQSAGRVSSNEQRPRQSFMTTPDPNDSTSPGHTVTRADIRASAEKILYTYLLPGSEREIILPENMVNNCINMIEDDGRDDPEVFDSAKDYVFQAMERDAFPGFLQAKALGNLVPLSIVARLAFALASFGGGFWGAFYVVLSDKPRHIRCWVCRSLTSNKREHLTDIARIGHSSFCHRFLLPCFLPVQDRPGHGSSWVQRVHVHELDSDPGALRTPSP